jgi:hypothetical protein
MNDDVLSHIGQFSSDIDARLLLKSKPNPLRDRAGIHQELTRILNKRTTQTLGHGFDVRLVSKGSFFMYARIGRSVTITSQQLGGVSWETTMTDCGIDTVHWVWRMTEDEFPYVTRVKGFGWINGQWVQQG